MSRASQRQGARHLKWMTQFQQNGPDPSRSSTCCTSSVRSPNGSLRRIGQANDRVQDGGTHRCLVGTPLSTELWVAPSICKPGLEPLSTTEHVCSGHSSRADWSGPPFAAITATQFSSIGKVVSASTKGTRLWFQLFSVNLRLRPLCRLF